MTLTEFEKRAKNQGGCDRAFDDWKIIDIHEIPLEFKEYHEIDFYCSNGKQVYLLRLRNRQTEFYDLKEGAEGLGFPVYLIAEFPIQEIDDKILAAIINKFNL